MRYSSIEIPSIDEERAYFNDPEDVKNNLRRFGSSSLAQFIAYHSEGNAKDKEPKRYAYKDRTEQGIERFGVTEYERSMQIAKIDELLFIPESHPLFNGYIIKTINKELFLTLRGSLPRMSYKEFQTAVRDSVNASNK